MERVRTVCPFCGVGCGVILHVDEGRVVGLEGDRESRVSSGRLCIKGAHAHEFVHHKDRLKAPLIKRGGKLAEASWGEALTLAAGRLKEIIEAYGPESVGVLASAKGTNEENYLIRKFADLVLGTLNVDQCARLCHSATEVALSEMFGLGAMTTNMEEIERAEVLLVMGANPAEEHPILFFRALKAMKNGAMLIVVDPRRTPTAMKAGLYLRIKPGTDDGFLLALVSCILRKGLHAARFMEDRTSNFEAFKEAVMTFDLGCVEGYCGIPLHLVEEVAELVAGKRTVILYGMGLTQSSNGVSNVRAVAALALITGNIGRDGSGVAPLRGQNNVQGASDMGTMYGSSLAECTPEYCCLRQKIRRGLTSVEMLEAVLTGEVHALYIIGENPAMSHPDLATARRALSQVDFLLVQDIFPTETTCYAHVVLPAASYAEKDGTVTNTERRVQRLRKAVEPPGEAKADLEIVGLLAEALGHREGFFYSGGEEVFEEIRRKIPLYSGITYRGIDEHGGVFWPCYPGTPPEGKRTIYRRRFYTPSGKARFMPIEVFPPSVPTSPEYPFQLITGRLIKAYQTGTMSRRCPSLEKLFKGPFVEVNPQDATRLGLVGGERVRLKSERGTVEVIAKPSESVPPGVLFLPFHFHEAAANFLTLPELNPLSKTPEYKATRTRLEPI